MVGGARGDTPPACPQCPPGAKGAKAAGVFHGSPPPWCVPPQQLTLWGASGLPWEGVLGWFTQFPPPARRKKWCTGLVAAEADAELGNVSPPAPKSWGDGGL